MPRNWAMTVAGMGQSRAVVSHAGFLSGCVRFSVGDADRSYAELVPAIRRTINAGQLEAVHSGVDTAEVDASAVDRLIVHLNAGPLEVDPH